MVCHLPKKCSSLPLIVVTTLMCVVGPLTNTAWAFTFEVTNTNDSGAGSLREALINVISNVGNDVVEVNLPPGSVIKPLTALPTITQALTGDRFTMIGNGVTISGENLAGAEDGLSIDADEMVIFDVNIVNFPGNGIRINGNENIIADCRIGTDGTTAMGNGGVGVLIETGADNIIGHNGDTTLGNVISGNTGFGIRVVSGVDDTLIHGNLIGLNAAGTAAIGNGDNGIENQGQGTIIGDATANFRNVISGNSENGIEIRGSAAGVVIQGNYIGTNASGTAAVPNGVAGIDVSATSGAVQIGGTGIGEGNIVSGNAGTGVALNTDGTTLEGNIIGASSGGTALANAGGGILILNLEGATIGGSDDGAGNQIAFNTGNGISLFFGATGVTISRNSIHDNTLLGIDLGSGTNGNIPAPTITGIAPVTGTAVANSTVEIFVDDANEGKTFVGATTSDGAGNFSRNIVLTPFIGMNLTATVTNSSGSTSEFSVTELITDVAFEGENEGEVEGEPNCDVSIHSADINADNSINLSELLRVIQIFNLDSYAYCPEDMTEDGFCPGQ